MARNARRDLAYATKTGGLGGALSIVSTALFGILSLRDAARSAASVASVLELVRLVFKWPGTKLWDLGTRMYEFGRGVDPMIEDADAAIRTARAIQAGEAVTDTDYEMMKREQARIVAQLGRTSMPARCAAVVGGSALLGAGAVLRGCALAARSAAYPMRLLTHAGNVSMAFAAAGGWFSEGVRAARALAAEGQVAPGLAGGFAYISSPASTLRDVLYFLKDAAWPAAVTLYEFVAGHVWGLTGAAAMIATGGAVLAYLLRDTRVGERALAAFRSYRYMRFGLGTTWNVVSSVSTLYSLFFAVPICWPIAIPVSVLVVGSSAWKLHKSLETLREAGGGSGSENKFVGGKNDDEDEYMPTVEGDVIMVDSLGNPISREDAAQFMLDLRRFAARRAAEAAEYLNVNRDTVFAEEALKLVTDSAVDVRELSQDEIVMRRIRTEFALAPLRPPFPSPARLLSMRQ